MQFDANLKGGLASQSIQSGIISIGTQVAHFLLSTANTVILARLLSPEDFGLIAMVTVVMGFIALFKDAGLSMATIQREHISRQQVGALFWVNIYLTLLLSIIVISGSGIVSAFYGIEELRSVTVVMSLSIIFSGVVSQHQALLKRQLRFGKLAVIQLLSQVIGLSVTIWLAYYDWGYWSLVGGILSSSFSGMIITFLIYPWIPPKVMKGTRIIELVKFGGNYTGFNFITYFTRTADNMIIGKIAGAEALGLYAKAYGLFMLPINQIRGPIIQVALPVLSKLKGEPERYRKYYTKLLEIIALLAIPIAAYCFLEAKFLIHLMLGDQWGEAVPIFKTLAISGIVQPTSGTVGVVLLSIGNADKLFRLSLVTGPITIISFLYGVQYGPIGVATAFTLVTYVLLIPRLYYSFSNTPIDIKSYFRTHVLPFAASMIAVSLSALFKYLTEGESFLFHLGIFCLYFIVYSSIVGYMGAISDLISIARSSTGEQKAL